MTILILAALACVVAVARLVVLVVRGGDGLGCTDAQAWQRGEKS